MNQPQTQAPSQAFWQLDKSKAAKVGQSSYINGNTSDVFKILSAAWKTNDKDNGFSTYYLSLHIMNSEKSTAHIDIYYANSNNERYSGENIINALMLCSNTPSLSQVQGSYKEYDFDQSRDVMVTGLVAPELAGKKVGMFLADNHYFNKNKGEVKRGGLNLFNVFDADTRQLPIEKANNMPANPEAFSQVEQAMLKSSMNSLEKAQKAEIEAMGGAHNGFNNQIQSAPQSTTYQRNPAPQAQQQNQFGQAPTMGEDPDDQDIPF